MKHKIFGRKFSRDIKQRTALLRALTTSVLTHRRIETTISKAKSVAQIVEKMITKAKKKDINSIRFLKSYLYTDEAVENAFTFAKEHEARNGGYTRVVRTRIRKADASVMAIIEVIQ